MSLALTTLVNFKNTFYEKPPLSIIINANDTIYKQYSLSLYVHQVLSGLHEIWQDYLYRDKSPRH